MESINITTRMLMTNLLEVIDEGVLKVFDSDRLGQEQKESMTKEYHDFLEECKDKGWNSPEKDTYTKLKFLLF